MLDLATFRSVTASAGYAWRKSATIHYDRRQIPVLAMVVLSAKCIGQFEDFIDPLEQLRLVAVTKRKLLVFVAEGFGMAIRKADGSFRALVVGACMARHARCSSQGIL